MNHSTKDIRLDDISKALIRCDGNHLLSNYVLHDDISSLNHKTLHEIKFHSNEMTSCRSNRFLHGFTRLS